MADKEFNNAIKAFKIKENDVLEVEYNPID
jgi:hypothetical protein